MVDEIRCPRCDSKMVDMQTCHMFCPNCGGGFEKRPIRPKSQLLKHPASVVKFYKPLDVENFKTVLYEFRGITPENR